MQIPHDPDFERRLAARLMDVLIRLGLILGMVALCYKVFAPFLNLMIWAMILAVTLYPLHQAIAVRLGGREGLASTLVILFGVVLILVPTAILMSSLGDSVAGLVADIQSNSLKIPPPRPGLEKIPVVGEQAHEVWSQAYTDMPAFIASLQPKIGNLAMSALAFVASIGGSLLLFLGAFLLAGVLMAYGQPGGHGIRAVFERVVGPEKGEEFTRLCTATIRAVAAGVLGVAVMQALIVGLCLLLAGVPWAGALAAVVLVLGIAQVPALVVTLPAIGYLWSSDGYSTGSAAFYTVLLLVSGSADNVLKPLMLGRGVDAPMPIILLGALGGMAAAGILGMFVGATLLALGYQIFMGWVAANPDVLVSAPSAPDADPPVPAGSGS